MQATALRIIRNGRRGQKLANGKHLHVGEVDDGIFIIGVRAAEVDQPGFDFPPVLWDICGPR